MSVGSWVTLPHAHTCVEPNRSGFRTRVPMTCEHECSSIQLAWSATFGSYFLFIFSQHRSTTLERVVREFDIGEHDLGEYGLGSSTSEWRSERFWVYSGSRPRDAASRAGLRAVAWHREACDIGVVSEWLLGQNGTLRAYFKRGQT